MKGKFFVKSIFICLFCCSSLSFASSKNSPYYQPNYGHESYTAIVKEVIRIEYHGHTNIKYRVDWLGQDIMVPDTTIRLEKEEGETLTFLVMWHDHHTGEGTRKLLSFESMK